MRHLLFLTTIFCVSFFWQGSELATQVIPTEPVMLPQDKVIAERILFQLKQYRSLETGMLVVKVGELLLETPYVPNTLEVGDAEKLVINLRELDCTTFAENCLALARTIHKKNPDFNDFVDELKLIRYREGIIDEYPSRLHYFSDWIFNNDRKKLVRNISEEIGNTVFPANVNYMSNHPENYPVLKKHPDFVQKIASQESEITNRINWYIPKNKLAESEKLLHDGDILGITTTIPGMDISHVVIAVRKNGRIHIMHASLSHHKVLISDETLEQYLNVHKATTGIMVARPL